MSRTLLKKGDVVIFKDSRTRHKDLKDEEDWSECDGTMCVVLDVETQGKETVVTVRAVMGVWPNGQREVSVDQRHFRQVVKAEEIKT